MSWVAWTWVTLWAFALGGCRGEFAGSAYVQEERTVYAGIPAGIMFRPPAGRKAEAADGMARAWDEVARVGEVVNAFSPDSEVGRLNLAWKVEPWPVSEELAGLLQTAREVCEATAGAFDPTTWPLKQVFRQARAEGRLPDPERLAEARARTGMQRLSLEAGPRVRFELPDMALDLGGIAKGYAVDQVARMLRQDGVSDYLVRIGGEIAISGQAPGGRTWRIGVQHPRLPGEPIGVLEIPGQASISTSGPYEQPVVIEGQVFHHIFDPRTGEPASREVLGVTVVSRRPDPDGALVDALATGLAVLGPEEGLAVAAREGVEALFLLPGPGETIEMRGTSGMATLFHPRDPH